MSGDRTVQHIHQQEKIEQCIICGGQTSILSYCSCSCSYLVHQACQQQRIKTQRLSQPQLIKKNINEHPHNIIKQEIQCTQCHQYVGYTVFQGRRFRKCSEYQNKNLGWIVVFILILIIFGGFILSMTIQFIQQENFLGEPFFQWWVWLFLCYGAIKKMKIQTVDITLDPPLKAVA